MAQKTSMQGPKSRLTNPSPRLQAELQTLNSGEDTFKNKIAIDDITTQLEEINNERLKSSLQKKAAFDLLDNEKPTKAFLNMENAKELLESMANIKHFPITNGDLIREEARYSFQKIFDHQDNPRQPHY